MIETADIALLEDRLVAVANARELALQTMKMIDGNFSFAVGSNTAILLAAALSLLSPITTAVLHNGATLGMLLNSLRIRTAA